MKTLILLSLAVALIYAQNCFDAAAPRQVQLSLCVEYSPSSCCSANSEALVIQSLAAVAQVYGNGSCYVYARNFTCATACSPLQPRIATVQIVNGGQYTQITSFVDSPYANGWLAACANIFLPPRNVTFFNQTSMKNQTITVYQTVGQTFFNNSLAFVTTFGTASDPRYVPTLTMPAVVYTVGANPNTGESFNSTFPVPAPAPTPGTNPTSNGGTPPATTAAPKPPQNGISPIVPSFLGVVALFLALFLDRVNRCFISRFAEPNSGNWHAEDDKVWGESARFEPTKEVALHEL